MFVPFVFRLFSASVSDPHEHAHRDVEAMSADSTDTARVDARPLLGELPTVSGGEPTDEDIAAGSEAQALLMDEQERHYAKTPLARRIFDEFKQLIAFAVPGMSPCVQASHRRCGGCPTDLRCPSAARTSWTRGCP